MQYVWEVAALRTSEDLHVLALPDTAKYKQPVLLYNYNKNPVGFILKA